VKCPACGAKLRLVRGRDIEVDVCPSCRGLFFDRGELKTFIDSCIEKVPEGKAPSALPSRKEPLPGALVPQANRTCPRCNKPMTTFNYAYDSNIFLDRCWNCGGIWADEGEIAAASHFLRSPPAEEAYGRFLASEVKRRKEWRDLGGLGRVSRFYFFGPRIVLPLSDDTERFHFPFVTVGLIILNVAVFVWMHLTGNISEAFFREVGLIPARIAAGEALHTLFTSIFVHAGIIHLFGNMLFLWIFGDNVEDRLGKFGFLLFYLSAGLTADLLQIAVNVHSEIPAVGASGAVAGILGAYLIFFPQAKIKVFFYGRIVDVWAAFYLIGWLALQLLNGFLSRAAGTSAGVAWFAHIGGFAAGVAAALISRAVAHPGRIPARETCG